MTKTPSHKFIRFIVISLIGLVTITGFGYLKLQYVSDNIKYDQANALNVYSQNFEYRMTENELLLDILGSRLIENNLYQNKQRTHELLNKMMQTKPTLAGFGLTDKYGNFIATSNNIDPNNIPNLLQNPSTSESFKLALQSDRMIIGQNYYLKELNGWVVPLRKALKIKGKVVAVMTTGIMVKNIRGVLQSQLKTDRILRIIKNRNYIRVLSSNDEKIGYHKTYEIPVDPKITEIISTKMKNDYGFTIKEATYKSPNTPIILEMPEGFGKSTLASLEYLPKYDLWFVIFSPMSSVYDKFLEDFASYLIVFFVLMSVLFLIVIKLDQKEEEMVSLLQYKADHDSLTHLHNRDYLKAHFNEIKIQSKNDISLMFIDLDNFKNINDTFGHHIGDKLLCQVAGRLNHFMGNNNKVIRFGGDEFVIILGDKSSQDFNIAKRIIETLIVTYDIEGLNFTIGASIGIAKELAKQSSLSRMLSHADMAMYEAKKRKNSVQVFSDEIQARTQKTTEIEHHLRSAIHNKEIYVNYQPQLNKTGQLHGVECLVRWQSPSLGFISPNEFIPLAEEIGIMPKLGNYIIQRALTELSQLQNQFEKRFQISINISIKQFLEEQFFGDFITLVEASGIPFKYITVEVTESLFIEDIDSILTTLDKFRRKGISISLDDFGTGFSSLSILKQLPIQELKIDRTFVEEILTDKKDAILIENIINIASEMGMYTLAEGVETLEQLNKLNDYECDLYQGYFFSKPLRLLDLTDFVEKHKTAQHEI